MSEEISTTHEETFFTWENFYWFFNLIVFAILQSLFKGVFVDNVRYALGGGVSTEMAQIYWGLLVMVQLPLVVQDKSLWRMLSRSLIVFLSYMILAPGIIEWGIASGQKLNLLVVEISLYTGMMVAGIAGVIHILSDELVTLAFAWYRYYENRRKAKELAKRQADMVAIEVE